MDWHLRRPKSLIVLSATFIALLLSALVPDVRGQSRVAVVADTAQASEQSAAAELANFLGKLYPSTTFDVGRAPGAEGTTHVIVAGTIRSRGALLDDRQKATLRVPGSFVVFTTEVEGKPAGCVVGADLQGLWHGVYRLLERLGCGFYLSFDTVPAAGSGEFALDDWAISDRPLVPVRMVFDWHNFLSGCSTWNGEHWRKWIAQSQKMGYNAVMVHAYGNNPMAGFRFRGRQKPVGYLSSTRVGRDWSTNHVNDVRRLWGGELFDSPVFGTHAAVEGSDRRRTEVAQQLMSEAFTFAGRRGMDVYLAVDVDTTSANPQELIGLLPENARFEIDVKPVAWMGQAAGKACLVNPQTPEGYGFYKAQVGHLLDVYPDVDCLVAWHRKNSTPWMEFDFQCMPKAWQEEFKAEVAKTPDAEAMYHAHHLFAQAKIVGAFQRAVAELGRPDVKIAFGSWDFNFLPAAHRFLPEGVALIPLDWMVLRDESIFDTPQRRASVAQVASHRPVIPVAWAHHDDGNYVGRPYTPLSKFHDRLVEMRCDDAGYGIIHWTTKPLDLYFKSLVNQVWAGSRNQPLEAVCGRMAADLVGPTQADRFGVYLREWVTTMPKIGRETSDFFIDHELGDLPGVEAGYRRRMTLLDGVDRSQTGQSGREWLDYFAGLERYVLDVHRVEDLLNRAKKQYAAGELDAARRTMRDCRPEEVIVRFARFSQHGGLTRGEQGLVVTMNTRWLTHYTQFRQVLGLEPVRYNFAATSHDLLAQSRGIFTFHFDANRNIWQTLGRQEMDCPVFTLGDDVHVARPDEVSEAEAEICRMGIESDSPIRLAVTPIMKQNSRGRDQKIPARVPGGRYRLTLLTIEPSASSVGQRVFDVKIEPGQISQRVDVFQRAGARNRIVALTYSVELDEPDVVRVTLSPVKGTALICGLKLEPVD